MIHSAEFSKSSESISQCPKDGLPEFAFIGRSNVGKSSLINMLCDRKKLAKTSQRPGKTQLINHFIINKSFYFVDLPGYGYAKASRTLAEKWMKKTKDYLKNSEALVSILVLIDSRIPPQKIDLEFINNLGEWGVPFNIVYTKSERAGRYGAEKNMKDFETELLKNWDELPERFITSSVNNKGKEELYAFFAKYVS